MIIDNKWSYIPTKIKDDPYESILPQLMALTKDYTKKEKNEQTKIILQLIKLIRTINEFPIFYFNEQGIDQEIQSIINKNDVCLLNGVISTQCAHGLLLLDYLFPNLHQATTFKEQASIYDRFYQDNVLETCLDIWLSRGNDLNSLRTMFMGIGRLFWDTPINFSPMRAKIFYECFCPKDGVIYDYSAGYGGRMLGALSSKRNFTYIATEPNTATYQNLLNLGSKIERNTLRKNSFYIYNKCSEDLILPTESIDLAFSCPPFFKKEKYSDEDTQSINKYPDYCNWLNLYVKPTIINCYNALKPGGVYGVDISNYIYNKREEIPLIENWCMIAEEIGFYFKGKIPIISHQRRQDNEFIYLFMKSKDLELPNYNSNEFEILCRNEQIKKDQKAYRKYHRTIGEYDIFGNLINTYHYQDINIDNKYLSSKAPALNNKYYRLYCGDDEVLQTINVKQPLCIINNTYLYSYAETARYLNTSRQAIQQAHKRNATTIIKQQVVWLKKI